MNGMLTIDVSAMIGKATHGLMMMMIGLGIRGQKIRGKVTQTNLRSDGVRMDGIIITNIRMY